MNTTTKTLSSISTLGLLACLCMQTVYAQSNEPYIGEIQCTGTNFAPVGFAPLAGSLLSISQNIALFELIGTTYGGDGQTTFALPDMRGRAIVATDTSDPQFTLGSTGGAENFTVTAANLPKHSHGFALPAANSPATSMTPAGNVQANKAPAPLYAGGAPSVAMAPTTTSSSGSGAPATMDNMKPFTAVTCYIALFGIFPSQN